MSNKEYYHDKGEKDASSGKYNPPSGADDIFTWSSSGMKEKQDELDAYNRGYSHTKGQIHHHEGHYDPPSSEENRDAYDSGYSGSDNSSSGCFITTATLVTIGKTDSCDELNIFRDFRDTWLAKQSDGHALISEYYKTAPSIVNAIDSLVDNETFYKKLWVDSIEPCLNLIKQKRFEEAKLLYCKVVVDLKMSFLDNKKEN